MTHFSYYNNAGLNSKYLYFYGTNKTSKNNKIQRKSEHKIAFPAKLRKCTYDLLAFNRRGVSVDYLAGIRTRSSQLLKSMVITLMTCFSRESYFNATYFYFGIIDTFPRVLLLSNNIECVVMAMITTEDRCGRTC